MTDLRERIENRVFKFVNRLAMLRESPTKEIQANGVDKVHNDFLDFILTLIREEKKELLTKIIQDSYAEDFKTYDYDKIAEGVLDLISELKQDEI